VTSFQSNADQEKRKDRDGEDSQPESQEAELRKKPMSEIGEVEDQVLKVDRKQTRLEPLIQKTGRKEDLAN